MECRGGQVFWGARVTGRIKTFSQVPELMEGLPYDTIVEIFLYAGIRAGVRTLSTCKTLRAVWAILDVPNKRTSELMWFKFCQANGTCPPPLDYGGFSCYRHVEEAVLGKFPLPRGLCNSCYNSFLGPGSRPYSRNLSSLLASEI